MKKKTKPPEPNQLGRTFESVLKLINALPRAERTVLFQRLASHPDNWVTTEARSVTEMSSQLIESLQKLNTLSQLRNELKQHETVMPLLDEALEANQFALDTIQAHKDLRHRQATGPRARAETKTNRCALIRQFMDAGIRDPKQILSALKDADPDLGEIKLKTVKNHLAEMKSNQ